MLPENLTIAVLMGGPGSEREVSLASGKAVLAALKDAGLDAVGVDVTGDDFVLPEGAGLAFNVIHGTFGEDGKLQRILEERGVPYTGAGSRSSEVAFDKNIAKARFVDADLRGANLGGALFGWTVLGNIDLSAAKGLADVRHGVPSEIGVSTLYKSQGKIPEVFLRGCGVPENLITQTENAITLAVLFLR